MPGTKLSGDVFGFVVDMNDMSLSRLRSELKRGGIRRLCSAPRPDSNMTRMLLELHSNFRTLTPLVCRTRLGDRFDDPE